MTGLLLSRYARFVPEYKSSVLPGMATYPAWPVAMVPPYVEYQLDMNQTLRVEDPTVFAVVVGVPSSNASGVKPWVTPHSMPQYPIM